MNRIFRTTLLASLVALLVSSCGIYSFSGTSIQPDVQTVTINFFEYTATRVNPNLSNDLTEKLKSQFRKMTRLEQVDIDGDLEISGKVTGYDVQASSISANEVAEKNKLTITISVSFVNNKYPEDNFEKNFSQFSEYDSINSLDAVESTLCAEIIDKLIEDVFNATVANW